MRLTAPIALGFEADAFMEKALWNECQRLRELLTEEQREAFDLVWFDGLHGGADSRVAYERMRQVLIADAKAQAVTLREL